MALLEGMATGLPVIATDVAGSRQVVVPGESGMLVAPGDPRALASAVTHLLEDDVERGRLGRGALERVQAEFSAGRQAARHAEVYEASMTRRQRP